MADNNDIESLEPKKSTLKKNTKTNTIKAKVNPIQNTSPTKLEYKSSSSTVVNFLSKHQKDLKNVVLPSPNVKCLDCGFARWREMTDKRDDVLKESLECFCKDWMQPVWDSNFIKEVTDCDGPDIAKSLAKKGP